MANYSYICGFEMGALNECYYVSGSPTIQNTYKRSGGYALRATNLGNVSLASVAVSTPVFRAIFGAYRFYLRVLVLPTSGANGIASSGGVTVYLQSTGKLSLDNTNWSTEALSIDGLFHRICVVETGGTTTLYVDGSSWITRAVSITAGNEVAVGIITGSAVSTDVVIDDILIASDDNAGVDMPAGNVILLPAVSDNTDGTWTAGAGGTSLFTAVDSIPPIGDATPTDSTQITNVSKTGNQDVLLNCRTYTNGGIAAADTINAVMAICCDGEQVATGTKDGSVRVSSNPTDAGAYTFDFGDDVGALGDFPSNWKTHVGPTVSAPSVTKASSPVITIRKTVASTRATDVCFAGVYVDYRLPVSTAEYMHGKEIPAGISRGVQRGMMRMYR